MSSRQDHPNNAAGVPMIFPVWLENFQIKYINPVMSPLAKKLPGFTVVKHRGRKSGKQFETTVNSFRKGDVLAIGLLHGKTNWVKNVLAAGEADIRMGRKDFHLVHPRLVPAGGDTTGLPRAARAINRRAGVLVADIG